ncbi:Uncharacterised protein [Mycobacteroides abscessus subsp. abscessus]|nr:Uncharacterised protein [Mycobacteroides abscessus subsp. abscessus]
MGKKPTATQPSNRYSGTPTQRGAVGQHIFKITPASAPPHTMASTRLPSDGGIASIAKGV